MLSFLRHFSLDRLSFWLGFLAGILFWWIFFKLRPQITRLRQVVQTRLKAIQEELTAGVEVHHRNDTVRQVQRLHLAAALFSLDEVGIEPRLLAPPAAPTPGGDTQIDQPGELAIPYLPDWPELAAIFRLPTISIVQALSAGANLALIGRPGSGKTTALAQLACQVARRDATADWLGDYVPVFLHIGDLTLNPEEDQAPLDHIINILLNKASTITRPKLPVFLPRVFEEGRVLFLLDGLDELSPSGLNEAVNFLGSLLKLFPKIRIVTAASELHFDGLIRLGFHPIPIARWDERQRQLYLERWNQLWEQFVAVKTTTGTDDTNPVILMNWLLLEGSNLTPLEFVLKVWGAYAGDTLGAGVIDIFEAHLRRMSVDVLQARPALEKLAQHVLLSNGYYINRKEAQELVAEFEQAVKSTEVTGTTQEDERSEKSRKIESLPANRLLPDLLDNNLLIERGDSRLVFAHPAFGYYLAACMFSKSSLDAQLDDHSSWTAKTQTLEYLAGLVDLTKQAERYLGPQVKSDDPLLRAPLLVARWLHTSTRKDGWRPTILRYLANLLQREDHCVGLRARALTALLQSGEAGLMPLIRQMLVSDQSHIRHLGILGCGISHDEPSINDLSSLLDDPSPVLRRAICWSLLAIGTPAAIEAVAAELLHGDEDLRRIAAEVLAANAEEGHAILKEGSVLDDLLVRRAVVFGLARIPDTWARLILDQMAVEDKQWVVRNAAQQAIEERTRSDHRIPAAPLPLSEVPWLIAFAGERGVGITPGQAAKEMLLEAIKAGNVDQQLAALELYRFRGDAESAHVLYQHLYGDNDELSERAFNTLWHLAAAGIELPSPIQYGFS